MSASAFISAIKDSTYKQWLDSSNKNKTNNIILRSVTDMRKGEEVAEKTSFLLNYNTLEQIARSISVKDISLEEMHTIFEAAVHAIPSVTREVRQGNEILFNNVSFGQISSILDKSLASIKVRKHIQDKQGNIQEKSVSDTYQIGHVFSIAANTTAQTAREIESSSTISESVKSELLRVLNNIATRLRKEDLESSNIKDIKHDLYAKYSKNIDTYLVEMQLKTVNIASGTASAPIINAIKRYLTPQNYVQFDKFFKTRAVEDSFITNLIKTKGSPSYLDLVAGSIVDSLQGLRTNKTTYYLPSTKLGTIVQKVDSSKRKASISKQKQAVDKAIANVNKLPIRTTQGQFYSLASLQTLLNTHLQDVVSANMGDGNNKNILNYRTGRFASSVVVERLSQSRAGAITAFYTYQKNPYQTFEYGFKQGYPISRDPKLLISKSIREIAVTKVANTMRSVRV